MLLSHPRHRVESSIARLRYQDDSEETIETTETWPRNPRAYLALLGCFLCMFNSWGLVNAFGTFLSFYREALLANTDTLLLNLIGSTESFVVLFFSFVVGRLLDAGYYQYLTGAGWILVSLGMFTLSQTTTLNSTPDGARHIGNYGLIWLTQGLLTGLGMACLFVSSSQIAATWFKKRKSFAIGIVACGASVAGVVYPLAIRFLIKAMGWEKAILCVGAIVSSTGLLTFVIARPNADHPIRKPKKWLSKRVWVDTHAFTHPAYLWFVASIAALFFGFYAVFFNLEEWSVASGVGFKEAADAAGLAEQFDENDPKGMKTYYLLCIMNGASSIGRLGAAYLSDHFGAVFVHSVVTFASAVLVLTLWVLTNQLSEALAFVVLFGAVSGSVIGLPPASVADILGPSRAMQAKLGQWTGMMYTIAAPFALTGPVIAGYLIEKYSTFLTVQLWSGICLLLSSLCMGASMWCMRMDHKAETERKMSLAQSTISSAAPSAFTSRIPSRDGSKSDEESAAGQRLPELPAAKLPQ